MYDFQRPFQHCHMVVICVCCSLKASLQVTPAVCAYVEGVCCALGWWAALSFPWTFMMVSGAPSLTLGSTTSGALLHDLPVGLSFTKRLAREQASIIPVRALLGSGGIPRKKSDLPLLSRWEALPPGTWHAAQGRGLTFLESSSYVDYAVGLLVLRFWLVISQISSFRNCSFTERKANMKK